MDRFEYLARGIGTDLFLLGEYVLSAGTRYLAIVDLSCITGKRRVAVLLNVLGLMAFETGQRVASLDVHSKICMPSRF